VRCTLDAARAPRATAMVVALADGRASFRDPASGEVVRRPYYERMSFFRAIAGGLVQTGCPLGNGTGHPGFRIPVEPDPSDGARLARPGALFLARYNLPPNRTDPAPPPPGDVIGTQLVVGLTDMSHLAGKVTVLGTCEDLDVARRISDLVAKKQRPVELRRARVDRPGPAPEGSCPAERP
jgi:peptidyl-prolyl cis-trans isomerase A (cyclophilin A)